jgi:hypothetical protein
LLKRIVYFLSDSSTARKTGRATSGDAAVDRRRRTGQESLSAPARGSLETALYLRMALLSADNRALLQRLRAFQSIGGELKFPHKVPLNAVERL